MTPELFAEPYIQLASINPKALQGGSRPHYGYSLDKREFFVKGPDLAPDHPHVAANEIVCAQLARQIGIKVPTWKIAYLAQKDRLYFGSEYERDVPTSIHFDEHALAGCTNKRDVYWIVAFDGWTCNTDRRAANLIVRHFPRKDGTKLSELTAIDHGHCLLNPGDGQASLFARLQTPPIAYVKIDCVRDAITEREMLDHAIAGIERISEVQIRQMIDVVPEEFLTTQERGWYLAFLLERQQLLRGLFGMCAGLFPHLRGAVA